MPIISADQFNSPVFARWQPLFRRTFYVLRPVLQALALKPHSTPTESRLRTKIVTAAKYYRFAAANQMSITRQNSTFDTYTGCLRSSIESCVQSSKQVFCDCHPIPADRVQATPTSGTSDSRTHFHIKTDNDEREPHSWIILAQSSSWPHGAQRYQRLSLLQIPKLTSAGPP